MYQVTIEENKKREQEKFLQIYNEYRTKVYHCAMNVLRDSYLAEDAVQEVFIKFTKNEVLNKIEDIESPRTKAYISVLTKHVVYDMFNKRKRAGTIFTQDELEEVAKVSVSEDITQQVLEKFSMEELSSTISKLPDVYEHILVLKYVEQFNDKELAVLLNIKEATARKRLERARKLFRIQYMKDFSVYEMY